MKFTSIARWNDAFLPIAITSLSATWSAPSVLLSWETAPEQNTGSFVIEHANAVNPDVYEEMGSVAFKGSSAGDSRYTYLIDDLLPGKHRFRVMAINGDGSSSLSPEVEVVVPVSAPLDILSIYPNPFSDAAGVHLFATDRQKIRVEILDIRGRSVGLLYAGEIGELQPLDLALSGEAISPGVYIVRVTGERTAVSKMVTVVR